MEFKEKKVVQQRMERKEKKTKERIKKYEKGENDKRRVHEEEERI